MRPTTTMFQESDCQPVVNRLAIVAAPAVAEKLGFVRRHMGTMNSKVFVVIAAYLPLYADSLCGTDGAAVENDGADRGGGGGWVTPR